MINTFFKTYTTKFWLLNKKDETYQATIYTDIQAKVTSLGTFKYGLKSSIHGDPCTTPYACVGFLLKLGKWGDSCL